MLLTFFALYNAALFAILTSSWLRDVRHRPQTTPQPRPAPSRSQAGTAASAPRSNRGVDDIVNPASGFPTVAGIGSQDIGGNDWGMLGHGPAWGDD